MIQMHFRWMIILLIPLMVSQTAAFEGLPTPQQRHPGVVWRASPAPQATPINESKTDSPDIVHLDEGTLGKDQATGPPPLEYLGSTELEMVDRDWGKPFGIRFTVDDRNRFTFIRPLDDERSCLTRVDDKGSVVDEILLPSGEKWAWKRPTWIGGDRFVAVSSMSREDKLFLILVDLATRTEVLLPAIEHARCDGLVAMRDGGFAVAVHPTHSVTGRLRLYDPQGRLLWDRPLDQPKEAFSIGCNRRCALPQTAQFT